MKSIIACVLIAALFTSCKNDKKIIVEKKFTDSLLSNYTLPASVKANATDLLFWKNRIDPKSVGLVDESRYASMLIGRFHLFGDVNDIKMADSIMQTVNAAFNEKEASPNLSLCAYSILQHRFTIADNYLEKARKAGLKKYESLTASFDVDFEMGRYTNSASYVQQLKPYNDYGYYFRRSKLEHLNGAMDSAIQAMLSAAALAESSAYLKDVALANAADLYIHNGELKKANDLYMQCIRMNSADFHSITGLGWIALVHDKNDSLAQQLFEFVHSKNKLPDPLFKLYQMAQLKGDSVLQTKYANVFATQATDTIYGNMYNKYLIEIYTGILHNPVKAEAIAKNELTNRSTPQTNAWYVWTLFCNGKKDEAYKVYQQSVSGKPLEGLELYWMGKFMQGLGKGYNAQEFFKAANKNHYDLSPAMALDLEKAISL
ncbi:MAG: hypothetical protein ABJB86_12380 [Bacteroidota bacterium]